MKTIPSILRENAVRWPDRTALIASKGTRDTTLSFSDLEAASNRFAEHLIAKGIRSGDRVLVFVPMSVELYTALLGLFRLGATAVFIDPSSGMSHLNKCCAELPIRAMIAVRTIRWIRPFVRELRKIGIVLPPPRSQPIAATVPLPDFPDADSAALITFTSGSTGRPKAAVRSHRFLIAQHEALKDSISLQPGERDLTTLPVFVLANLASGVASILPDARISHPGSVDAKRLATQSARLRPTRTGGSPAFYQRLLKAPEMLAGFEKIYMGGAPVFPSVLRAIQAAAPNAEVTAVYGSTEAEPIAHVACSAISPKDWESMRGGRGLLAGEKIPEIRLRIIEDQWGHPVEHSEPLSATAVGEILVTGEHVLQSYLGGRGDSETKVRIDGAVWHRTGDAGYLDSQGRLWLMGRCAAAVRVDSEMLYPFAIECVAMTFRSVHRAAFVCVHDRRLLAVELVPDCNPSKELDAIRSALEGSPVNEVLRLKRIPVDRRHNAKIDYPALQKQLKELIL